MEVGSVRGSIFALAASAIGSGVLTLPSVASDNGFLCALALVMMGSFGCYWSLYMLVQRARHHGLMNYSSIAMKAGGKNLVLVLQISILCYMFATCLACQIVITELFVLVSQFFGVSSTITGGVDDGSITWYKAI